MEHHKVAEVLETQLASGAIEEIECGCREFQDPGRGGFFQLAGQNESTVSREQQLFSSRYDLLEVIEIISPVVGGLHAVIE
ncbi:hypothetical protein D3C86_1633560 [compost metagenome]